MKDIIAPEHTKTVEDCPLRAGGGECCNALNYLRPHTCNAYCVAKVDKWIRSEYPEMDENEIVLHVAKLTHHDQV